MTAYDVVIVGAGHAGAQAAVALRQRGYEGSIGVVGEEPELPYERPPLSKEYLAGGKPFERLLIRPRAFWQDKRVDILTDTRIVAVNPDERVLTTADDRRLRYGSMIWATGGTPRRLDCEGYDLKGVHTVRTRADVDRLVGELATVERVVVVGGGFIGLEAAAVLTKLGKAVVVLEAQGRLLARVCGTEISSFYEEQHRAHGVDVRTDTVVAGILGREGAACGVMLANGDVVRCEMVIVGIGIIPAVAPLLMAGATDHNGVLVDADCRTELPSIYAIGDCARRESRFSAEATVRLESVQNASIMAGAAVAAIMGEAPPPEPAPWFWSNQFDLRLQTAGLTSRYDETVVRGTMTVSEFSIIYLREGRMIAIDCVNAAKDFAQAKGLIGARPHVPIAHLADRTIPLRESFTGAE